MIENILSISGFSLVVVLLIMSIFNIIFVKNLYTALYSVFIVIFLLLLISSLLFDKQIHLGEFLSIIIFQMISVIFFIFNLNDKYMEYFQSKTGRLLKISITFIFLIAFSIVCLIFNKFVNSNVNYVSMNEEQVVMLNKKTDAEININKLTKNKIFQKLTNIIIYYISAVVLLYYYSKDGNTNEEEEQI